MDGQRFDRLTRALATRVGRRTILKAFAVGVMPAILGQRGAAAANSRPIGAQCKKNAQCATDFCDPATRQCIAPCPLGNDCGYPQSCAPGCSCYCDPFVTNPDGSLREFCLQDPPDPPACADLVVCFSHDDCARGTFCTASSACGADAVCLPLCAPSAA
jgi:hypothetical protein